MKCPHCEYENIAIDDEERCKNGEHGDFYELGVNAQRPSDIYPYIEKKTIYVCPSCEKLFIN